jgi:hypothetical protein
MQVRSALLGGSVAFPTPALLIPDRRIRRVKARDGLTTFDAKTRDSTGAFLIGELERLDQKLHQPLVAYTWSRDILLRSDVTIADEVSSFTNSSFASAGGIVPNGKAWLSKDANSITGIALDIGKTANPLNLWAMEVKYTIPELESAMKLGRPVDQQKFAGMTLKHQMDTDEQVYIGDTTLNVTGLINNAGVTVNAVANGAQGSPKWTTKTPDEILADVNGLLNATWQSSGWARIPTELRLPPAQYNYLVSQKVSNAGNLSIMKFLIENNLANQSGQKLNIQPVKWLIGQGVGGTPQTLGTVDRMIAYSNEEVLVRFPMVPLQRTPLEYRSLFQITTYYGRLGVVEFVYPETVGYADGI